MYKVIEQSKIYLTSVSAVKAADTNEREGM